MMIRSLFLLLSILLVQSSFAQDFDKVEEYWNNTLDIEKQGLVFHTEDYQLMRMVINRTSTADAPPYPQMRILVDSMDIKVKQIQEFRRELAGKKDKLDARLKKAKNPSKDKSSVDLFNEIQTLVDGKQDELSKLNSRIAEHHAQFNNLKNLFGIKVITYADYLGQFNQEMEGMEQQFSEHGDEIASLRVKRKSYLDAGDMEKMRTLDLNIVELESIHELCQAKLTQLHNYQDRLGTTNGDELIYFGPGIDPPYELKTMKGEIEDLEEYLVSYDVVRQVQLETE